MAIIQPMDATRRDRIGDPAPEEGGASIARGAAPAETRAEAGWHAEDIKAELRKRLGREGDVTALSRAWGYDPSAISKVLARPGHSRKVEVLIAGALGLAPHAVWPDRWHADGTPKRIVIGVLPDDGRGRAARPRVAPSVGDDPARPAPLPHRQKDHAA